MCVALSLSHAVPRRVCVCIVCVACSSNPTTAVFMLILGSRLFYAVFIMRHAVFRVVRAVLCCIMLFSGCVMLFLGCFMLFSG